MPTIKFKLVPHTPEDPGTLLVFKCKSCKEIVLTYEDLDAHVSEKHPNATSMSVDVTPPFPQNRRNMSDKNVAVWALQGEDEPVQVGVASEPNADGVRSINIFPEYKKYKSKDLVFGEKPEISVVAEEKVEFTPITVESVPDDQGEDIQVPNGDEDSDDDSEKLVIENQQPDTQPAEEAEGAQATPAPAQQLRRDRPNS